MGRRRHTPEQIITALREAEVGLANGKTAAMVSRELGISEQTYYRWRKEFGGMKVDQARRLKDLERENAHLKRAVANLTVDKLILEEAAKGKLLSLERRRMMCGACASAARGGRETRVPGAGPATDNAAEDQEGALRRGGAPGGRGAAGEPFRSLRLSSDHESAAHRRVACEPQARGADLASGGPESAQTPT